MGPPWMIDQSTKNAPTMELYLAPTGEVMYRLGMFSIYTASKNTSFLNMTPKEQFYFIIKLVFKYNL